MKTLVCIIAITITMCLSGCVTNRSRARGYSNQNITPNAYGQGVNSNQYGQPTTYKVVGQPNADTTFLDVKQDAYGSGVGSDQYGRRVTNSTYP